MAKVMYLMAVVTLMFLLWNQAFSCHPGQEKLAQSEWIPLRTGSQWTYRSGGKSVVVQVTGTESVDSTKCAKLEAKSGDQQAIELLGTKEDGVYRFKFGEDQINPPLRILALPANDEQTWKVDSKVGDSRIFGSFSQKSSQVKVPAGTYEAIETEANLTIAGDVVQTKCWYVQGIGMVKQTILVNGVENSLELEKFVPGK